MQSNKTLKLRIERTEKTTEKDINDFYIKVYRMAENLGFKCYHLKPQKDSFKLPLKGDNQHENRNNI